MLLVVEPKGQSLTLAAELKGLNSFRTPSHIAGILLNNCTARMHALLAPMLEKETGLPVLGFLPKLPEAVIGSRHLGLYTAAEVENLQQKLALLADAAEEHIDWPRLLALCEKEPPALPEKAPSLRPASASPWRRTRRSALPTPRRWRPSGTPGQRWSFSAPSATQLCRKTSAGCICPAATRNFTQEN